MKKLLVIALIAFSCSEEDVKPCFSCEHMKQISAESYEAWQVIYKQMPNHGTLKDKMEWWDRNEKAKGVYLKAESLVANNCYNHETKRDY